MLRDQDGLPLGAEQRQVAAQALDGLGVQVAGRLVQKADLRLHGVDGGKGDPLLLPAGEGEEAPAQKAPDTQLLRRPVHPGPEFRRRPGLALQAEGDLAVAVHVEKLRPGVLEDAAHLLRDPVHGQRRQVLPVQQHPARQLPGEELGDEAVDEPGEGGLAAAAAAAEQDALPVGDGEAHVMEPALPALRIAEGHMLKLDHRIPPVQRSSMAKNAAKRAITTQSAAVIRMVTRQVRGFGFSMPRVTAAMESSSAARLAAVSRGT